MKLYNFIFATTFKFRLSRHVIFWLVWIVFTAAGQLTGPDDANYTLGDIVIFQIVRSLNRLFPQIFFCYAVVYYLVPRFIPQKKYVQFAVGFMILFLLLCGTTYLWFWSNSGLTHHLIPSTRTPPFVIKFFSFYSNMNFTGALPACCLMLLIRYYKDLYLKQKKIEKLMLENSHAELQLLKAQVHPHFLFNTLNNIYSFTLTKDPSAANLVDKLAGMIDYMNKEGSKTKVTIEKEIQLLEDYIGLEKIRYGDRLDMQTKFTGNFDNKMIAPLLMIPFVENSFKHGISKMRGNQWIRLNMHINGDVLDFELSNSKMTAQVENGTKRGIGLSNVQKRLNLIYPELHDLAFEKDEHSFLVRMRITLE